MSKTFPAVGILLLLLGQAAAGPDSDTLNANLRAVHSGAVWKYTESGITRYYFEAGDLAYGQWYNVYPQVSGHEHGTVLFDLAPIPKSALVLTAELGFSQYTDDSAGTPPYYVRAYDYAGADPESLFTAVDTADTVSSILEAHHGWNRVKLTDAGTGWINERLRAGYCRLAIAEDAWGELGSAHGCPAVDSLRPYLLVNYHSNAIDEGTAVRLGNAPAITPNPADGLVTLHCPPTWNREAFLGLYDCSGRVVLRLRFEYGMVRLDCSQLANGVYIARSVSGMNSTMARLVIQHR